MVIVTLLSLAICGTVYAAMSWMTDDAGHVDDKGSLTDPPS